MNKIALFATASSIFISFAAQANGGTIQFKGKIISNTCMVNTGTPDFTVTLGDVPASALATASNRAGQKEFVIKLSGCSGSSTKVAAKFQSGDADLSTGYIKLDTGSDAENVQVAIYDAADQLNKLGQAVPLSSYQTLDAGAATLRYSAWYVATGTAKPGLANANATYTLNYE